jgi:hypothetical protein
MTKTCQKPETSVVDPVHFDTDPDPRLRTTDLRSHWLLFKETVHLHWYIIHIFKLKLVHTYTDTVCTPVQAYTVIMGCYSYTLIHIFSSQDTFCFCILCRLQWDWFLYICISALIHIISRFIHITHIDTASTSIFLYADTVIHWYTYSIWLSTYILFLHSFCRLK